MSANPLPVLLNPRVDVADSAAAYWLRQVTLRLRREVSWCWANRAGQLGQTGLPPLADAAAENLDLTRYDADKHRFFETDVTAKYLSEQLSVPAPLPAANPMRGSWEWVALALALDDSAQFVLALALAARLDSALGAVCSTCLNDASRPYPTFALAQRLWNEPNRILALADAAHPLFRHGLFTWPGDSAPGLEWHQPLDLHAWTAQTLIDPNSPLPAVLEEVTAPKQHAPSLTPSPLPQEANASFPSPSFPLPEGEGREPSARTVRATSYDREGFNSLLPPGEGPGMREKVLNEDQEIVARRLSSAPPTAMQVVPLIGVKDADYAGLAAALSAHARSRAARVGPTFQPERQALTALAALAWLRGLDLVMPEHWPARHDHHKHNDAWFTPVLSIPVRWYVPVSEPSACQIFPTFVLEPACRLPALTYDGRREVLRAGLGARAAALEGAIAESARRYRFERRAIERVMRALPREGLTEHALLAACRAEALAEFGHLAQPVASRFTLDELVLPPAQAQQIDEIRQAMNALTVVHYGWGTARAWNEGGLAVLFGGPPGTGKTMTAEAMAVALELPMYRIDLSQVVNKYIGETEKNLKRIFDAAELADCVLFFDEADALFGKRTDVKDAHDRFANIEISYLLERMERFKGLAILATNRKKDLDEAFMRRLRYVVEFPMPGVPERERLWRGVFPACIDTSDLDFRYLARQFPLSGGHIRSIAFNACLLSASESGAARVAMVTVLVAVKRELDKLNRAAGEELFGVYAPMLKGRVA